MRHVFHIPLLGFLLLFFSVLTPAAQADTAFFSSNGDALDNADLESLAAVDGDGYFVPRGQTLVVELATAFATNNFDQILNIYYSNPNRGRRLLGINFGYEVNGVVQWVLATPQFFQTRGNGTLNLTGFANSCSVAGGCTYLSFTAGSQGNGVVVDALGINGQILTPGQAAAPTPEPGTWALILLGFAAIAWRLKTTKTAARRRRANIVHLPA